MRNHSSCPLPESLNDLAKIVGIKEKFLFWFFFLTSQWLNLSFFYFCLNLVFCLSFFFLVQNVSGTHTMSRQFFFVVRQHFPIILVQNKITLLQKITICKHKLVINSYLFFILGDYTDAQRSLQTVYYQAGKKPQLVINNIIA